MWMLLLYTLYVFIAHMHVMMSCGTATGHKEITIHLVALYLEQSYIVNQLVM